MALAPPVAQPLHILSILDIVLCLFVRLIAIGTVWLTPFLAVPAPSFLNPGFEEPNTTNNGPASWTARNQPVWTFDPAEVHSGTRAVRVTQYHDYNQLVQGVDARTHLTLGLHARPAQPPARYNAYTVFLPPTVVPYWVSRRLNLFDHYTTLAVVMAVPPASTAARVSLLSVSNEDWVDTDDLSFLAERVTNGGFEPEAAPEIATAQFPPSPLFPSVGPRPEVQTVLVPPGWNPIGAAHWDSTGAESFSGLGAVRSGPGEGWTQTWAAMDDGQRYLLSFRVRSASLPGTATITLEWLDSNLALLAEQPLTFPVSLDWTPQVFILSPPSDVALAAASIRFVLRNDSTADFIWFDEAAWQWVGAYPSTFSPNGDGLWDTTELVAWWPDGPGWSPIGYIRSDDGYTTAPLYFAPTSDGAPGMWSATWNGLDADQQPAPPGPYAAVLSLPLDTEGSEIELEQSLSLRRDLDYPPEVPPYVPDTPFIGGVWLFLAGPWTNADYDPIFDLVRADGFQYAIAFPALGRYRDCVRAAARYGVRIILNFWETNDTILGRWSNHNLTEDDVRSLLEQKIAEADALSSPVIGIYLVDEPTFSLHIQWASWFMRVLGGLPTPLPGFATLLTATGRQERLDTLRPPVALFDFYPLTESAPDTAAALSDYAMLVSALVEEARAVGRDCWIIGQGFSAEGVYAPPGPGGMRAMVFIAAASGARGFFPFLYLSTGGLEGLRGFDLSPRPRLAALASAYRDIEALGSVLTDYSPDFTAPLPPTEGPVYLRLWSRIDDPDARLLWIVNLDVETTRTAAVTYQEGTAPGFKAEQTTFYTLVPGGFTQAPVPAGSDVTGVVLLPPSQPADPLAIDLPTLADAPIPATVTVNDLSANPAGQSLAVSCADTGFAEGGVYRIEMSSPGAPVVAQRFFTWNAENSVFDDTGSLLTTCDALRGLQVYGVTDMTTSTDSPALLQFGTPQVEWVAVSGNAHDVLPDGTGGWWMSAGFRGIRHLQPWVVPPAVPELREIHRIETGGYGSRLAWVPPPADESQSPPPYRRLAIIDEYSGIDLVDIAPDGTPDPVEFIPQFRGREPVAWNGLLAVARLEQGVDIYDIWNINPPRLLTRVPALSTVCDLALWDERVLLVSDGHAGLRCFDVVDPARPRELARLLPWKGESPFLTAVAAAPGWIAVAARGRGVRILDPAPLQSLLLTRTWMFY